MQYRDPPAYQEYAASVLAKSSFRELTLAEKGLLYTLKLECWVNSSLPRDSKKLALYVGSTPEEIDKLLPNLMVFFKSKDGRLFSPELESYRQHLAKVSEGRRKGAEITNSKKSSKKAYAQATNERTLDSRSSEDCANAEITLPSLVQFSSVQLSSGKSNTASNNGKFNTTTEYTYNPDEDVEL